MVTEQKDFHAWMAEKAQKLSPSEQRLAAHLIEHLESWAFHSASQLSAELDMHRSTIVRFAQRLGLNGFPELQNEARHALLGALASPPGLALTWAGSDQANNIQSIYERELQNLSETYRHLDAKTLETTARNLADAGKIVVFGRRFSYSLAMYLSLALNTMRPGVTLAPEAGGSSIDQLFDLSSSDYALVVSIRRYSPEIRRTLDFLAGSNIPCTLLTDVSPLAEPTNGTHVIQAHIGSTSVLESFTALISVSHALLSLVQRFIPESRKRLAAAEQAWRRFNKNG